MPVWAASQSASGLVASLPAGQLVRSPAVDDDRAVVLVAPDREVTGPEHLGERPAAGSGAAMTSRSSTCRLAPSWAKLVRKSAARAIVSMAWRMSPGRAAAITMCDPAWISMVR
jgi:hypothetical protein